MKYVADLLTISRILLSLAILILIISGLWSLAIILFILAILTDTLDGTIARKWPYSSEENKTFWWRKDPHLLDNTADMVLTLATLIGLIIWSPTTWGLITGGILIGTAILLITIRHLRSHHPVAAERVDVFHGWCFVALLLAMLVAMTINATSQWPYIIIIYGLATIMVIILKWDRVISRPETRNPR